MASLETVVTRAIEDFDNIEAAIEEMGVDVPAGTDTSEYGGLIRSIGTPVNITVSDSAVMSVSGETLIIST